MFDKWKAFYKAEKQDQPLTTYFMEFTKTYEELNMLLPFVLNVKIQQQQRERMDIMSFLAELPTTFETVRSQIISSSDITSLQEVLSLVLRTEGPYLIMSTEPYYLKTSMTQAALLTTSLEAHRILNLVPRSPAQ